MYIVSRLGFEFSENRNSEHEDNVPMIARLQARWLELRSASPAAHSFHAAAGIIVSCLLLFHIWLVTAGLWTALPPTTNYYAALATAFSHGHLFLEIAPAPEVLDLPNPYDPAERSGIDVPGDVSLYNGKYYLYFGPVPALILAGLKPLWAGDIGDGEIVFAFVAGIFVFQYVLLLRLRRRFFPSLPGWTFLIGIGLIGLQTPITSMLGSPSIHEASIAGGQFFFIGGFYFALVALDQGFARIRSLILVGIFWAASVGTRTTQLVPIGVMILLLLAWIAKDSLQKETASRARPAFLGLLAPIMLLTMGLLWYNWARFGSLFEFGLRYQLTWNDIHDPNQILFSPLYILQNSYNYLLAPFRIARLFPFIMVYYGRGISVISAINLPAIYHPDKVVGLIYSTPFLLLAALPTAFTLRKLLKTTDLNTDQRALNRISISFVGIVLAASIPLLFFFWNVERYMADFIPALTLLSVVGFWQGHVLLTEKGALRQLYSLAASAVALVSMGLTMLLAVSMGLDRFRLFNPELIHWLRNSLGG